MISLRICYKNNLHFTYLGIQYQGMFKQYTQYISIVGDVVIKDTKTKEVIAKWCAKCLSVYVNMSGLHCWVMSITWVIGLLLYLSVILFPPVAELPELNVRVPAESTKPPQHPVHSEVIPEELLVDLTSTVCGMNTPGHNAQHQHCKVHTKKICYDEQYSSQNIVWVKPKLW